MSPPLAQRVVVAIPCLNEASGIEAVVRGLTAAENTIANLRIIAVDGGSSDGTQTVLTRLAADLPVFDWIDAPGTGISAAVNLIARDFARRADILVRCDAHAAYPPDFLSALVHSLERSGAVSLVVPMDSLGQSGFQKAVAWVSDSRIGSGGAAHRGGRISGFVDHGHHAAFRLQDFLALGGYDESFSHNEDAELDCRLRANGAKIFLDAAIRVVYRPRGSIRALARQYFLYGKGRSRTMRRHPGSARLRQLAVPSHLFLFILSLAAAAISRQAIFLAWPAVYGTILLGTSLIMTLRKRSWCGLWAGPAAGVMHTAWALGFLTGLLAVREPVWARVRVAGPRLATANAHGEAPEY